MLQRLQQKWKVGPVQLVLILCVFAITGTTTAYISKAIISWVGFTDATPWGPKLLVRLAVLIFGYQIILLIVAFFFGQFSFFWKFERKLLVRLRILREKMTDDRQPMTEEKAEAGFHAKTQREEEAKGEGQKVEGWSETKPLGGPTSNFKPQTSNFLLLPTFE